MKFECDVPRGSTQGCFLFKPLCDYSMTQVCPNDYFITTALCLNPTLPHAAGPKNIVKTLIYDVVLYFFGTDIYKVYVIMCNADVLR
jgi:hypothetical protein